MHLLACIVCVLLGQAQQVGTYPKEGVEGCQDSWSVIPCAWKAEGLDCKTTHRTGLIVADHVMHHQQQKLMCKASKAVFNITQMQ